MLCTDPHFGWITRKNVNWSTICLSLYAESWFHSFQIGTKHQRGEGNGYVYEFRVEMEKEKKKTLNCHDIRTLISVNYLKWSKYEIEPWSEDDLQVLNIHVIWHLPLLQTINQRQIMKKLKGCLNYFFVSHPILNWELFSTLLQQL